jgi:hypothetical protein
MTTRRIEAVIHDWTCGCGKGQACSRRDGCREAAEQIVAERATTTRGPVSDVARARGLAEALAKCPDDHTVEGVREVGAEIAALLARVGGQ